MSQIVNFNIADINPEQVAVLKEQGVSEQVSVSGRPLRLVTEATESFASTARPIGMLQRVSSAEFGDIFEGEGLNNKDAILSRIYPQATGTALFAVSMGSQVSQEIERRFAAHDFARGYVLDSVASLATDQAVGVLEELFSRTESPTPDENRDHTVLSYSPGYCGWHISGQKKLFDVLNPGQIGISLNDSYLMAPLKSASGVLVSGKSEIHIFKPSFGYCQSCRSFSCKTRMKQLRAKTAEGAD